MNINPHLYRHKIKYGYFSIQTPTFYHRRSLTVWMDVKCSDNIRGEKSLHLGNSSHLIVKVLFRIGEESTLGCELH